MSEHRQPYRRAEVEKAQIRTMWLTLFIAAVAVATLVFAILAWRNS